MGEQRWGAGVGGEGEFVGEERSVVVVGGAEGVRVVVVGVVVAGGGEEVDGCYVEGGCLRVRGELGDGAGGWCGGRGGGGCAGV